MSRKYVKTSKRRQIAVGYDTVAQTFFAQTFRRLYENDRPTLKVRFSCEIKTIEECKARLKTNGVRVPSVVLTNCEADSLAHDNRPKLPTEWKQEGNI